MKNFKYVLIQIGFLSLLYLLFSFSNANFNMKEWNSIDRYGCASFMMLSFYITYLIYIVNERKDFI